MNVKGRCLCGQINFALNAEPLTARVCWCRDCQYLGAGTGMANVGFPSSTLVISGPIAWFKSMADSGNEMERGFCPTCGTPLLSKTNARPHLVFIRAGALDDPEILAPEVTIWTKSAPSWACFDPGIPTVEGQPSPPQLKSQP
jgi:hypothetical protein